MKERKTQIILLVCLAGIVLIGSVITGVVVYKSKTAVVETTREIFATSADTITYTDIEGRELALEDYLGKVLVVVSWASWSPFSATDLANLDTLAAEISSPDVVFIAMNRKETKEQAARYLATERDYQNLILVIDTEDKFYSAVSGYAMPESLVFNQKGEIVLHDRGVTNINAVRDAITMALTE